MPYTCFTLVAATFSFFDNENAAPCFLLLIIGRRVGRRSDINLTSNHKTTQKDKDTRSQNTVRQIIIMRRIYWSLHSTLTPAKLALNGYLSLNFSKSKSKLHLFFFWPHHLLSSLLALALSSLLPLLVINSILVVLWRQWWERFVGIAIWSRRSGSRTIPVVTRSNP